MLILKKEAFAKVVQRIFLVSMPMPTYQNQKYQAIMANSTSNLKYILNLRTSINSHFLKN
jgi:hypothetical protein